MKKTKKTIGDFRKVIKHLSGKNFGMVKIGIVLNHVRNIDRMIVNGLPDETKLPKEAEEQLLELEILAQG